MIEDFFLVLSGEHISLPVHECLSILESENIEFSNARKFDQILIFSGPPESLTSISKRAAMVHSCCKFIFKCKNKLKSIYDHVKNIDFKEILADKNRNTFAVRVKRVKEYCEHIKSVDLERKIGKIIKNQLNNKIKVNLEKPDILFYGVLTEDSFIFGEKLLEVNRTNFRKRRADLRPFFWPGTIDPIISRVMVNLSQVSPQTLFLDPFCGTGGFLIEACLIGAAVIGSDIDSKMVEGSKENLEFYFGDTRKIYDFYLGDARKIPLSRIDAISTDPPYGHSSSTRKQNMDKVIKEFLECSASLLRNDGYLCIALPEKFKIIDLAQNIGFNLVKVHEMRVHKSMTRYISVFKK